MEDRHYAKCQICKQEMKPKQGCKVSVFHFDEKIYERVKAENEFVSDPEMSEGYTCHDCFVFTEQYHHYGCDAEVCPVCHGQLIGCACDLEFEEIE